MNKPLIDLHIHTTASDGTDTPAEVLEKARRMGLSCIAVTDHDTAAGCIALCTSKKTDRKSGPGERTGPVHDKTLPPVILTGAEFSCRNTLGKYHILGYRFRLDNSPVLRLAEKTHLMRIEKIKGRIRFLKDRFGFSFSDQEIEKLMANQNPGKPHIGNLMVKKGYARSKEEAICRYINQYHRKHGIIGPEEVTGAIARSGGLSVLAHPLFGDGSLLLTEEELAQRLEPLMACGLKGMECFYSGHTENQIKLLLAMAKERGLHTTAGSDYHGKNKPVPLGRTGLEMVTEYFSPEEREEYREVFRWLNEWGNINF